MWVCLGKSWSPSHQRQVLQAAHWAVCRGHGETCSCTGRQWSHWLGAVNTPPSRTSTQEVHHRGNLCLITSQGAGPPTAAVYGCSHYRHFPGVGGRERVSQRRQDPTKLWSSFRRPMGNCCRSGCFSRIKAMVSLMMACSV